MKMRGLKRPIAMKRRTNTIVEISSLRILIRKTLMMERISSIMPLMMMTMKKTPHGVKSKTPTKRPCPIMILHLRSSMGFYSYEIPSRVIFHPSNH